MLAIIVAGGLGTRIQGVSTLPKVLLPVAGRPLLSYHLEKLQDHNIQELLILTGVKHVIIKNYVNSINTSVNITLLDENYIAGSGGWLNFINNPTQKMLVIFGDIIFQIDLSAFINFHIQKKSIASLVLQQPSGRFSDCDLVSLDANSMCSNIYCKPHKRQYSIHKRLYMIGGIFLLEPEISAITPKRKKLDLVHDIIAPAIIKREHEISGYFTEDYLQDIGTPQRYYAVNEKYNSNL